MPLFFVFSDESGKYKKERSPKFVSKNPFYCRSAVILEAQDWIHLKKKFSLLKKNFLHIDPQQEVKWSYIWSMFKHFQKKEDIPKKKPYFPLRSQPLDRLVEFIRMSLDFLRKCTGCQIILTLTFNEKDKTEPLVMKDLIKLHLTHILESVEGEMQKALDSACLLFFNREDPTIERSLKEAFTEIYYEGFPLKYPHIKDSLNFEYFPQSFGSQVADYCAGVFNGCCRLYPQSVDLFLHQIWPKVLKEKNEALGYGITEIPKNPKTQKFLHEILQYIFTLKENDYRISLESRLK